MAVVLKKNTFLQEKKEQVNQAINYKQQAVKDIIKGENSIKTSLKILASGWKNFIVFLILIPLTAHNPELLMLTLFFLLVVAVLTIGYTKRPAEDKAWELKHEVVSKQYKLKPWEQGLEGEQTVAKELEKLPDSYYVIHDVIAEWKGRKAQIDHVVIGPTGVFAIETKSLGGDLRPHPDGWLQARTLIKSPQRQSQYGANILSKFLEHKVQAVVTLTNSRARWLGGHDPICPVIYSPQLTSYILNQPQILQDTPALVKRTMDLLP